MAVHVDAQTDMLLLTSGVLDYNAAYSIGGWFNLQADRDTFGYFMAVGLDGNNYDSVATTSSGVTFRAEIGIGGSFPAIIGSTDLTVGDWYFVVQERESTTSYKAYLFNASGTLLESLSLTNSVAGRTSGADRITLGGNTDNATFWVNSYIAGVKAYTAALGTDGWRTEMWQYSPFRSPYAVWPLLNQNDYNDYGPGGLTLSNGGIVAGTAVGPPIAWRRGRRRLASVVSTTTHTATAALTAGAATLSASASHAARTYTATAALTAGAATLSASATHDAPEYTATSDLTAGAATLSASATHAPRTYTATATLTAGAATLAADATHTPKTYTATSALTAGAATLAASAEHDHPVYAAIGSLVTAAAQLSASATFTEPVYTASAALTVGAATLAGVADVTNPHIPRIYNWGAIGGVSLIAGV